MRTVKTEQLFFNVAVLKGAAEELVSHRELRERYETNRSIKTWSAYFLLKSLTTSGKIQNWIGQKQKIFSYCQMNEQTFRARLRELKVLNLIEISKFTFNITLVSFKRAAEILGIDYNGTIQIQFNPESNGQQTFQYLIRAEEIRNNQTRQLEALCYKADKNPLLKQHLMLLLAERGCHVKQLENDPKYFQVNLLALQQHVFRLGSDLFKIIHLLRADINRGVKKIKGDHKYKHASGVSYMKAVMSKLGIISIEKLFILSNKRCRLYMPQGDGPRVDLAKYLPKQKRTGWRLTDQLTIHSKINIKIKKNAEKFREAA